MTESLKNKKVLLGVTGSIAAYKSPNLVRELVKAGAEVRVVMTDSAKEFVSPLVMSNLSRNDVVSNMFDSENQNSGAWHINLSHWCDLMIIAPATATTIARISSGLCDNALTVLAVALPRETPLALAPAMDFTMLQHPTTVFNLEKLKSFGAIIIPPEEGELSSGLSGSGRMPKPDFLRQYIEQILSGGRIEGETRTIEEILSIPDSKLSEAIDKDNWNSEFELELLKRKIRPIHVPEKFLEGKNVLITSGPTHESIDDVRFIANRSTGRMGYALAVMAREAGAKVTMVSGPVDLVEPDGIELIKVKTAEEMYSKSIARFPDNDLAVLAAAVADYTPVNPRAGKIKKTEAGDALILKLVATKDILAEMGRLKKEKQFLIGFALETENAIENGKKKLHGKNCDMIVVNQANKEKSGFGSEYNTITILARNGERKDFPPLRKEECALEILKCAVSYSA